MTPVSAIPEKCKSVAVGDRVLEINGITYRDFESEKSANDLFDVLTLGVVPNDDVQESEVRSRNGLNFIYV